MTSLRQQIGQMLMMGFNGCDIHPDSPVNQWLRTDGLGGVLLFDYDLANKRQGKNLENQRQISQLTQKLKACHRNEEAMPLFVALDYEGGAVDRLKYIPGCPPTLSPAQMAKLSAPELTAEIKKMAHTLSNLGFNLNFAPVVDLSINEHAGIIGKLQRSFSADPDEVIHMASRFVSLFAEQGLTCCYKHFPGHGSASGDTHEGFVDVSDSFKPAELDPYIGLIQQKSHPAMIMTAHVINRQLDNSGLPATLSPAILTGLLREKMGFDGVIISDDLQMHAISHHFSVEESLCLTINAGADMIIFANQLGDISATEVIDIIERLVHSHKIPEARITDAYRRIIRQKQAHVAKVY